MTEVPWQAQRTPQQQGLQDEAKEMRRLGARAHPRSGAGDIKHDGSTRHQLYEHKSAGQVHTLNGEYLHEFWTQAVLQAKEPVLIVQFANGVRVEAHVTWRRT